MQFDHQYRAPPPPMSVRQFSQLEMPLSQAFQRLVEGRLIAPLLPRPPLQPTPLRYQVHLHYAYHHMKGHDTNSCAVLRHAIQYLIDQGIVELGRIGVTTDPFPTHDTRVIPPHPEEVHLIESVGNEIFMMGWDGKAHQPINLYVDSDFIGYTSDQQIPRPFRLTLNWIPRQPSVSPVYL